MPVSGQQQGKEHQGFMGVPIKKRKFLYLCSSPPPPPPTLPDPVPHPPEKELDVKPEKESKSSSAASPPREEKELLGVKSAVGPLVDSNDSALESTEMQNNVPLSIIQKPTAEKAESSGNEIDEMQLEPNKGNSSKVPISQEPVATAATGSGSELSTKCTLAVSNDTAFQKTSQMQMEPNEAHLLRVREETGIEKGKGPKFSDTSELLLESPAPPLPDLAVKDDERISQEVKLDPCTWNSASTEEKILDSPSSHNPEVKASCIPLETNRTHWDLNTTMDRWDSSMNHSGALRELATNEKQNAHIERTVLSESEGSLGASTKKTLEPIGGNSKLPTLTTPFDPQTKNDLQLHLSLSSSSALQTGLVPALSSAPSSKADAKCDVSGNQKLSRNMLSLSANSHLPLPKIVKSEPSDESKRQNFLAVQTSPLKFRKDRMVKTEPSVGCLQEHSDMSNTGNLKLMTPLSVKSESVCAVNQETPRTLEEKFQKSDIQASSTVFRFEKSDIQTSNTIFPLSMQVLQAPYISNCTMALPSSTHPLPCSTVLGLSSGSEPFGHSEIPSKVMVGTTPTGEDAQASTSALALDMVSEPVCTVGKKSEVADDVSGNILGVGYNVGSELPRVKSPEKLQSDGNSDIAGSDEEKINLSVDMQDECSSNSDDDSDTNHGASGVMDSEDKPHGCEDDDYEDGEVREPIVHGAIEVGISLDQETECDQGISDKSDFLGCAAEVNANRPVITRSCNSSGAHSDIQLTNEHDNCISGPTRLQETSGQVVGTGKSEPIDTFHRGLLNCSGKDDGVKGCDDFLSDGTVCTSQGITPGEDQGSTVSQQENIKGIIPEETKFSIWSETESPLAGAEATKDVNAKGNQSRIINLAQAFGGPSQGRKISFPGRIFPSRVVRERNDGLRNAEKLHLRGSRDDVGIDGRLKFERHRNHDLPVGNAGSEFMHERGRLDKRFDSPHAAVVVSAGRKPLSDELPNFRHPPRRRSPGGRGRPVSHGVHIVRRSDRDISPDRCVGRGDPNLMRLRPDKKFMRGLPADMMDTVISRSQPQFPQVDDHFVRRERSFSPIQRKGPIHMSRMRSRSPSRTRSPGPWSSPRRKSPDGFGRAEMIHRRSPPFYRVKRMRSPHQRSIFPDEVEDRRLSPPFSRISNDFREMGPSREADHPRPFIPNRSPSGRVLQRGSTRRFDMMERERMDSDDYFSGPMHSDRFHEVGGNGGSDGRRMCTERRRSFRPAYDAGEVEKFHFHVEGGRPYRYSPDSDADYNERGNLRDREFERRMKNRTANTPRRTRSVEEHEENYRHGEQGWHGTGFEDSPGKRRRF